MNEAINEEWDRLLAEKERQDRELAQIEEQLRALGDVGIVVPHEYFDEIEELCARPLLSTGNAFPAPLGLRA